MTSIAKFVITFIVGLFFCLSFVYAQNKTNEAKIVKEFTVELTPIKNKIAIEELAEFNLTITNNLGAEVDFRVYTLSYPDWDIQTRPLLNPIIVTIEPLSTKSIILFIDPLHITSIGKYKVGVNVKSIKTDTAIKKDAEVIIKSTEPLIMGYIPTVTMNVDMPSSIDPREVIPIRIDLSNQNMINYPELTIRIESDIIKEELKDRLGPNEEKTIKLAKKIDTFTKPQKDTVEITLLMGGRVIAGPLVQPIKVIEYSSSEEKSSKTFLTATREIAFSSNNNDFKGPIKIETTQLRSLFISTSPRAKLIKEDGKRYYSFDVNLQDNAMKIKVVENYTPLFVVICLSIIALLLYLLYRSPLIIKKAAQNIEKKEGGISQLKVVLTIKNRSKKPVQSIDIVDKVPNLVNIEKELHLGVLQPYTILKHEKKGLIVKWRIDDLNAGEERVISYRIKSKLPIIGDITLESASAKFKHEGREKITNSNTLSVV